MPRGVGKSGSLIPKARDYGLTRRQILGVSVSVQIPVIFGLRFLASAHGAERP